MLIFHKGFEEFCRISVSPIANALDCFPILRHLPDAMIPIRKYAKSLHKDELELYMGLYNDSKRQVEEGVAKVRISREP